MDIRKILHQAGFRGQNLETAYGVVMAESGGDAHALADDSDDLSYGLFQINMLGQMGPDRRAQYGLDSNSDLWDPLTNAKVAFKLSQGGTNFSPWTTYTSGDYKANMGGNAQVANGGGGGGGGQDDGTDNTRGQYGFTRPFLDAHPEIDQLITDAIKHDWADDKFQARVENTKWWRNHDQAQRAFEIQKGKDPGQVKTDIGNQRQAIATMAKQMGVDLSKNEIADMAERAARNQWQSNDLQMHIGAKYQYRPKQGPETGYAATSVSDLEAMASDYAVPISKHRLGKWTRDILQGQQTVEGYQDVLREQAKNLYPHLSYALENRNATVRSWADPYLQSAAQMLGVSPDTMRLDKGKWAGLLAPTADGTPMTMSQWQTKVRTENAYGYDKSPEALSQADDFIAQMGQIMGAR